VTAWVHFSEPTSYTLLPLFYARSSRPAAANCLLGQTRTRSIVGEKARKKFCSTSPHFSFSLVGFFRLQNILFGLQFGAVFAIISLSIPDEQTLLFSLPSLPYHPD
jgi:hypothetical protein